MGYHCTKQRTGHSPDDLDGDEAAGCQTITARDSDRSTTSNRDSAGKKATGARINDIDFFNIEIPANPWVKRMS